MSMSRIGMVLVGALCGIAFWSDPAGADGPMPAAVDLPSSWQVLSKDALSEQSGRQGVSIASSAAIDAVLADNSVSGGTIRTGANVVQDQAFQDLSGIGSVLMNSGNNVIMNNVTVVNINLQ